MRFILRPLALPAAHNPIETIVCGFILATFAYFHVLSAIKHSSFLAPPAPPTLRPAHVKLGLAEGAQWSPLDEEAWIVDEELPRVEIQHILFDLDGAELNDAVDVALDNYTEYLTNTISHSSYHAACFPVSSSPSSCFTLRTTSPPSLTLAFLPGERDEFLSALRHSPFTSNSHIQISSPLSSANTHPEGNGGLLTMLSGRYLWLPTAVSTLFNRLRTLFFRASPLDIALITAGYLLMHSTFFRLLLSSRALGSHFWLTAAILTSSTLGFVLALPLAMLIGIPVDPILLTEALPFLVCTVGFDKPLRLGRAVFQHEFIFAPLMPSSKHYSAPSSISPSTSSRRQQQQMLPAATLLLEALDRCGNSLLRDSALEIAVLIVGANSKVGGLRECCALAALILGVDCIMSATFLVAVMGVMIEVSSAFHLMTFRFACSILALFFPSTCSVFVRALILHPSTDIDGLLVNRDAISLRSRLNRAVEVRGIIIFFPDESAFKSSNPTGMLLHDGSSLPVALFLFLDDATSCFLSATGS